MEFNTLHSSVVIGSGQDLSPWQFRGKRIMNAMVTQLLLSYHFGAARRVLITGDSAGGIAAFNAASYIQQMLRHVSHAMCLWYV